MTTNPEAEDPARQRLLALLDSHRERFDTLLLTGPRVAGGAEADLERITVRPLHLRGALHWCFVHRHQRRDETHNHRPDEGLALVAAWLGSRFRHAHLRLPGLELALRFGKRGSGHLVEKQTSAAASSAATPPAGHDRAKMRWVDPHAPWLVALGVMTLEGHLVPAMARKWKQINRFVEIVAAATERAGLLAPGRAGKPLRVADFGAGRAYLSHALHGWLTARGLTPEVSAIEQRADLVAEGRAIAARLGLVGFEMLQGDVADAAVAPPAFDVMIALHACDTATDHALHRGIEAGAAVIVCSPCCHKELRPQLLSPHPLASVFRHGIHAEQHAEMLTDSLRALLLEAAGYDTQVFEFVALEHTRKNKMILAIRRPAGAAATSERALAEVAELQAAFGFRGQALLALLRASGHVPAAA